jgi:hypothetical protein
LTCAQSCINPCATCSSINSTVCYSCIAGYSYDSSTNKCNAQTICNNKCSVCPFGYSILNGNCLACLTQNCQTCNSSSLV